MILSWLEKNFVNEYSAIGARIYMYASFFLVSSLVFFVSRRIIEIFNVFFVTPIFPCKYFLHPNAVQMKHLVRPAASGT